MPSRNSWAPTTPVQGSFSESVLSLFFQAGSEHPLAKAILEYARHFHFFDDLSDTQSGPNKSFDWLLDATDFSALPGTGVQCFIGGKKIMVSFTTQTMHILVPDRRKHIYTFFIKCFDLSCVHFKRLATGS